jgi:hypothetical protein
MHTGDARNAAQLAAVAVVLALVPLIVGPPPPAAALVDATTTPHFSYALRPASLPVPPLTVPTSLPLPPLPPVTLPPVTVPPVTLPPVTVPQLPVVTPTTAPSTSPTTATSPATSPPDMAPGGDPSPGDSSGTGPRSNVTSGASRAGLSRLDPEDGASPRVGARGHSPDAARSGAPNTTTRFGDAAAVTRDAPVRAEPVSTAVANTSRAFRPAIVLALLVGAFLVAQAAFDRKNPNLTRSPIDRSEEQLPFS